MSDFFCFFTEADILDTQPDTAAFGPVKTSETTKYRVTSLHTATQKNLNTLFPNPKAFAVCSGHVRFQQNDQNANLVNAILQPTTADFKGLPVKYIIYRGILKQSLESAGLLIKPGSYAGDPAGYRQSKYINKDLNFYKYFQDNPLSAGNANLNTLGLAFNSSNADANFLRGDDVPISSIFFQITDSNPVLVKAGFHLGDFDKTGFGIEVIVAGMADEPNLHIARSKNLTNNMHQFTGVDHVINISVITDANEARFRKEEILCYIDPCAFFASLFASGRVYMPIYNMKYESINITSFDNQFPPQNPFTEGMNEDNYPYSSYGKFSYILRSYEVSTSLGDDFYRSYIYMVQKFFNAKKVYLDIRNENGFSLNFYNEYSGASAIGYDLNFTRGKNLQTPVYQDSEYQTHGWPIKILTFNSTEPGNALNDMMVSAAAVTTNYFTSLFRLKIGLGSEAYEQNKTQRFVFSAHAGMYFKDNIPLTNAENKIFSFFPMRNKLFETVDNTGVAAVIGDIYLAIPLGRLNYSNGATNAFYPFYLKLYYNKQFKENQVGGTSINTNSEFDNQFFIREYEKYVKWRPDPVLQTTTYWLSGREKFVQKVNTDSIINESYMVEEGIAVEKPAVPAAGRVIFFNIPFCGLRRDFEKDYLRKETARIMNVTTEKSFFKAFQADISEVTQRRKKLILINYKQPSDFLEYEMATGFEPNSQEAILALALSTDEYKKIVLQVQADADIKSSYHPIWFQAQFDSYIDDNKSIRKLKLFYIGFNSQRQVVRKEAKNEAGSEVLKVIGRKNIYASDKAITLETGANVRDQFLNFLVFHSSTDPLIINEEKETFRQAINIIERYATDRSANKKLRDIYLKENIYQKMMNYMRLGLPARVVHDYTLNYEAQAKPVPIKIVFNSSNAVNVDSARGETSTQKVQAKFFPNGPTDFSNSGVYMFYKYFKDAAAPAAPTPAQFSPQEGENSTFGANAGNLHNQKIYFDANAQSAPELKPSEFDSKILYRNADKGINVPRSQKVYFEVFDFKTHKEGIAAEGLQDKFRKGLTVEEATNIGYCAVDSVTIDLYTKHFKSKIVAGGFVPVDSKFKWYIYRSGAWKETDPTTNILPSGVKPEIYQMASTLIHELGHAYSSVAKPVEDWIWEQIENFYFYTKSLNDPLHPIVEPLKLPDYINFPLLSIRQKCSTDPNFDFKYGYGHIKGSVTGNWSCTVGEDFKRWFKEISKHENKNDPGAPPQPSPDNTDLITGINSEYCIYNLG